MSRAKKVLDLLSSKGVTLDVNGHAHQFDIDSSGNGSTISVIPSTHLDHKHKIVNFIVQESQNHDHGSVKKRG